MPGEPVKIGPFSGGLNTFSDQAAVDDNQLVECLNFEPDFDGSLRSRPPVVSIGIDMPLGSTGNPKILGTFYGPLSKPYLIASDGLSSTYQFDGVAWTLITATFAASAMAQFDNKAWLVAPVGSTSFGGYWVPPGTFTADANMPKGEVIVSHKLRLWIMRGKDATSNGTRLYFSKVLGTVPFWISSPDFVDIGGGDGQNIVSATVYYQSIILFRTNSIYSFSYTSDPASGVVSNVIPGIGLQNKECIATYENYIYFMYRGNAYEFINARATQINVKVPFLESLKEATVAPQSVSIFNDRVLFQWWDYTYVFYLKTRVWTRWNTPTHKSFGAWFPSMEEGVPEARCFTSTPIAVPGPRVVQLLSIKDEVGTRTEQFKCAAQTKSYSYEAVTIFKRLSWWGLVASFNGTVVGSVTNIGFNSASSWGQLRLTTWGVLRSSTWNSLSSDNYVFVSTRTTVGQGSQRKTVKMGTKAFRFRQVVFKVEFDTDGSVNTAPVRLNSLMTYVTAKQTVSKTVS